MGITLSEMGGAQKMVYQLLEALPQQQYDITLVTTPGGELIEWVQRLNLTRSRRIKIITLTCLRREINLLADLRCIWRLYRLMMSQRYEVAHFHSSKMGIIGPIAAWLARVSRIVFTVHGWGVNPQHSSVLRQILGGAMGLANRLCSAVICVSEKERQSGLAKGWISGANSRVIANGIAAAPELRNTLYPILGGTKCPVIGCICRLAEPKDPVFAIRVAKQLKERGNDFILVFLGDGPLREACEKEAEAAGVTQRVRFLGTREDARELLNDFDIFVLFSKSEALPVTVIEAMFAAKPVVASDVGGVGELVDHGVNGCLINPGELEKAVDCLETLLNDPGLRERMGRLAYQKAWAQFSRARMVGEYERVYRNEPVGTIQMNSEKARAGGSVFRKTESKRNEAAND